MDWGRGAPPMSGVVQSCFYGSVSYCGSNHVPTGMRADHLIEESKGVRDLPLIRGALVPR